MKELSIEEKVKAYDEALKQIKECTPDENGFITIYPQEIFPELKESESEDERIRKAIGYAIGQSTHSDGTLIEGVSSKEAMDWLEKQGKQKLVEWSEEDEKVNKVLIDYFTDWKIIGNKRFRTVETDEVLAWLKSLRPQKQWKPSEEQIGSLEAFYRLKENGESKGTNTTNKKEENGTA